MLPLLTALLVSYSLLPVEGSVVWKDVKATKAAIERRHAIGVGTASGRQVVMEDLRRRIWESKAS